MVGLREGISLAEETVTFSHLAQRVACTHHSCELSHSETHHGDIILQHLHRLIVLPAVRNKIRRSKI